MADSGETATELTATQYVILAENQRKKKALADSKVQFSRVADENRTLLRQLEDTQRENYEVTEHLRRELMAKAERIAMLEVELDTLGSLQEQEMSAAAAAAAAEQARLVADATARQQALQARVTDLEAELSLVHGFRAQQGAVEDGLLRLREENAALSERLEAQRTELERYYLELNTRLRKEYEQRLEELKKSAEEEVDERLDASVKRILSQNRRMAEELRVHVQETDVLQAEVRILKDERGRLSRELQLKVDLEQGYAQRGARQGMAIRDAAAKIIALEGSLQMVLAGFEQERASLGKAHVGAMAEVAAECDALRRLVKLKSRELKSIRRLAHEVLLQRSDVECFLLSSLHQVRRELERSSILVGGIPSAPSNSVAATAVASPNGAMMLPGYSHKGGISSAGGGGGWSHPIWSARGWIRFAAPCDRFPGRTHRHGAIAVCSFETGGGVGGVAAGPSVGAAGQGGSYGGRLELKDLSWADRERVLRLLFTKINNQAQQVYYSRLPAHGLDGVMGVTSGAGPAGIV
ncbi:MAG: hypothetical protein WDW36_000936 [Sanguina aurantia]